MVLITSRPNVRMRVSPGGRYDKGPVLVEGFLLPQQAWWRHAGTSHFFANDPSPHARWPFTGVVRRARNKWVTAPVISVALAFLSLWRPPQPSRAHAMKSRATYPLLSRRARIPFRNFIISAVSFSLLRSN